MSNRIQIEQMANVIAQEMQQYTSVVADELKTSIKDTAKESQKELKQTSPKRKGKGNYAKGWRSAVIFQNSMGIQVTLYNQNYRLPHLLEKGHARRGGGDRVPAIVHIAPVEEKIPERIIQKLRRNL